jgi:hypothetical protein
MWGQSHFYCYDCRALHRERSTAEHEDLPLCDKTNGKKCEVVQTWLDGNGQRRTDPFQLHRNNYLAMELYSRITTLSDLQHYEGQKKKGYYPTISSLDFVLTYFAPKDMDIDDFDLLVKKIQLIHQAMLNNYIGKLS